MNAPNALTVDVEDYFHVSAFAQEVTKESWSSRESRVVGNTHRLLTLFDSRNVRGTFFVLGWVAEKHPQLVRDIADRGHEVACHGYSHQLVFRQSVGEFLEETARAKHLLEDILGMPILGYRAASYSIVSESQWALDVLARLGFKYDSSIFPVRHDQYGIPDARREPYRHLTPEGNSIVEWPLSTIRAFGLNFPVAGGGYFRLLPFWFTRWGLKAINKREKRPFIFYLHPWELDRDQPRIRAGPLSRLRHYTNIDICEARLVRLLDEFQFTTAIDGLLELGLLSSHDVPQKTM